LLAARGISWYRHFDWVKRVFLFSGDGILSYSLFGIALAGFAASYYCGFNSLAYPEEFYGPTLELKSAFLPRYYEVQPTLADGYTSRVWLANAHFYLAFFFLQGGLWHFQRAMGFNINSLIENWRQNRIAMRVTIQRWPISSPALLRRNPGCRCNTKGPRPNRQPLLKRKQPFEDYFYRPSQGIESA
jgi:hypothetical protein